MLCSTCTTSLYMGSAAQTTPCGHIFHMDCLMTWFEQDKSCPLCRSECNASDLLKIHLAENEVHVGEAVLQDQIDTLQYKLQKCVEEKNDEYWRNEQLESFLKEKMEDIKHLKHLNSAVKNTLIKKLLRKTIYGGDIRFWRVLSKRKIKKSRI